MKLLNLIKNDPWLEPYSNVIERRYQQATDKEKDLIRGAERSQTLLRDISISDYTNHLMDGSYESGPLMQLKYI